MRGPVLVVGSGAREHALAWSLSSATARPAAHTPREVLVAPGNPGMVDVATVLPPPAGSDAWSTADLLELALRRAVELVVVGPEAPLVAGLADALTGAGVAVFGPTREASRLEGSKAFCREVAAAAGVPTAPGGAFDDPDAAIRFARRLGGAVAVKADGLAAGKGVTMCAGPDQAEAAIRAAMVEGVFGSAGARVVVERALTGREVSVIAICDATTCLALPAARDHKRLLDGDGGPNTGGMGAISPSVDISDAQVSHIVARFHHPVLAEMARRGTPFRGALYAGLMLTDEGPILLEFNVRLGDPEAQALLPRLAVPLEPLLAAAAQDRLAETAEDMGIRGELIPSRPWASVALVLAAPGYPEDPRLGDRIPDPGAAREEGCLVFAAGVADSGDGGLRTAGGRVLTVVGQGADLAGAAELAYRGAARVAFPGALMRHDIGVAPVAGGVARVAEDVAPAALATS